MTTPPPPAPGRRSPTLPAALAALAAAACAASGPGVPATAAGRDAWPSEAELTRLQPWDRHFNMGYNGEDVPLLLPPIAQKASCEPVRRKPLRLRCRYVLTVSDWVGSNPPTKAVEDLVERDPAGTWRIVPCPLPGFIRTLGPPRLDPNVGC